MFIQLAGQALTRKETLSRGDCDARWRMLSRVAAVEGTIVAKCLDEMTWAKAVARITAGARLEAGFLTRVDGQAEEAGGGKGC